MVLFGALYTLAMDPPVNQAQPSRFQAKRWCFTCNNPWNNKEIFINALEQHCKYIIIGDEVCPTTQTPHLQGYIELNNKLRWKQVQELFPAEDKVHFESCKGTPQQNRAYCSKEGKFVEFGSMTEQGKRTDLDEMCELIVDKQSMVDVAMASPATWVRNYRGLGALQALIADPPRPYRENFQCFLYYGKTGTGKTYRALMENEGIFRKPVGKGLWFDGCPANLKKLLLDEFAGQYSLECTLQITDKYPVQVEIKGGHVWLDLDLLIMTTNRHPARYYDHWVNREEQGLAFLRRLTKIVWFKARDDVVEIQDKNDFWNNFTDYE